MELSILDIQGRQVDILLNENKTPGIYHYDISTENLDQGIYFYRFKAGSYVESGKMVVID